MKELWYTITKSNAAMYPYDVSDYFIGIIKYALLGTCRMLKTKARSENHKIERKNGHCFDIEWVKNIYISFSFNMSHLTAVLPSPYSFTWVLLVVLCVFYLLWHLKFIILCTGSSYYIKDITSKGLHKRVYQEESIRYTPC